MSDTKPLENTVMIKVENLYKTFKTTSEEKSLFGKKKIDFHAVKNLNFEVEEGQVLSLLGPNGCGKTTTLRMIAGMLEPAKGTEIGRAHV